MKNERVFVSGGAGVIGLEMIPRLLARGAKVLVGDLKPKPQGFPQEIEYRQGDLGYMSKSEISAFNPTIFIHLAATFERSTESYEFWHENYHHNVALSHHLMTICKDLPSLKRVVFASSYLIYDPSLYQFSEPKKVAVKLKETDNILPRNLTGMAKLAHEIELRFLEDYRKDSFSSVCARIFRGYGRNSRDVISRWVRSALAGEEITVFRPEGLFDYLYAADSAEGLIRLAENTSTSGIINLGTGHSRRVSEVVEILKSHFPKLVIKYSESDIAYEASCADITQYKNHIGWQPEYDLEKAIPEIIEFEKNRGQIKPDKENNNVLVSSSSGKAPLVRSVQEAAKKIRSNIKIIAGDISDLALTKYIADDFWLMPRTDDVNINTIIDGCHKKEISTIIPTRDGELVFWAKNKALFKEHGINVIVSPLETINSTLDKLHFSEIGGKLGLPIIPSYLETTGIGLFVVKERFGAGSEMIGIKLDNSAANTHAQKLKQPIFQPFIEGFEISVDAWADKNHNIKGIILRKRDQVINGESKVTTSFRDTRLEAIFKEILSSFKFNGPIVLQSIIDSAGQPHVIEINPRIGGASTASIAAGLNSWYWSLLEADGADVSGYPFIPANHQIRQVRIPMDIHIYDSNL